MVPVAAFSGSPASVSSMMRKAWEKTTPPAARIRNRSKPG